MSENSGLRDQLASPYHRICGKGSYLSDIDLSVVANGEDQFGRWSEYKKDYKKKAFDGSFNAMDTVAYIDYKRMPSPKLLGQLPFYLQESADRKKPVPVFACLTFLDPEYKVKCYHTIPVCKLAEQFFIKHQYNIVGEWFSLLGMSKFHHQLRDNNWRSLEAIDDKDINVILKLDANAPLTTGMKQQDLPNSLPTMEEREKQYKLPDLYEITKLKMRNR
jgi:hypothetical protein